ncbi:hypothetical protein [Methylobacterium sp. SD21]|uniref:hypothetical protein n=1 Tax=Methylobacterium litchii TaxID=3138810 RepID=UPI00313EA75C
MAFVKGGGSKLVGERSSVSGRFVTAKTAAKGPTTVDMRRVRDALSNASEATGAFKSSTGTGYGDRKLPPKSR